MVTSSPWWAQAVIYQTYLRSFADSNGDGVGDLVGLRRRLHHLVDLGVDGLWLNPCFRSPHADHGYDIADYRDIDPRYGRLADFDELLAEVHRLGLRLLVDIVPNHCSVQHPWFQEALRAGPGTPVRRRFIFRPGRGPDGELPPNNWQSVFGGPAWTRVADGEWYLHLFAPDQPDFNWDDAEVMAEFDDVIRFWLDRGVDGLRIDVAHGLVKAAGLPDWEGPVDYNPHMWNQPGVHAIHQRWRRLVADYDPDRVIVGEVWPPSAAALRTYAGPDRLCQVFYFDLLAQPWSAGAFRAAIDRGLAAGAGDHRLAWTMGNHDVHRQVTRLGQERAPDPVPYADISLARLTTPADIDAGQRRARAALLLLLSLPGSVYLYQGEELGLPEVFDLPAEHRQDPIFGRTNGAELGRDGCRVPLPWSGTSPPYGFGPPGSRPWLPQPALWAELSVAAQHNDPHSTLQLYRTALRLRRSAPQLGDGELRWWSAPDDAVLVFERPGSNAHAEGPGSSIDAAAATRSIVCAVNLGQHSVPAPAGELLVASAPLVDGALPPDTAGWWSVPDTGRTRR